MHHIYVSPFFFFFFFFLADQKWRMKRLCALWNFTLTVISTFSNSCVLQVFLHQTRPTTDGRTADQEAGAAAEDAQHAGVLPRPRSGEFRHSAACVNSLESRFVLGTLQFFVCPSFWHSLLTLKWDFCFVSCCSLGWNSGSLQFERAGGRRTNFPSPLSRCHLPGGFWYWRHCCH